MTHASHGVTWLTVLILSIATSGESADIVIRNLDGAGEGFNDPTPAAPVGGNDGTTVGAQRLRVFERAAAIWGAVLTSEVTIVVDARFDPLLCDQTSAVLGSAGPVSVWRDFPNAPFAATQYPVALANALSGTDLAPSSSDVVAQFNASIDGSNDCLSGIEWYYGFDGNEGSDVELLPVVLHELAHGLGFSSFVDPTTGETLGGFIDVFSLHLFDEAQGLGWGEMGNFQRVQSAITERRVVWSGSEVTAEAGDFLAGIPVVRITSPAVIARDVVEVGAATFGASLRDVTVSGRVVEYDDATLTPSDACQPAVNTAELAGNIALVDRGSCTFVSKAVAAQEAGAIGVIVVNTESGVLNMSGIDPGTLTIPSVMVSFEVGNEIRQQLGNDVRVTLLADPDRLAGTSFDTGRVLMYTPNPLIPGSSVAHWDVSATPNLLMEPSITFDISTEVDLTRALFRDLGWFADPDTTVDPPDDDPPPVRFTTRLRGNRPNPFNPDTTIVYEIGTPTRVEIAIFDNAGRRVRTLLDEVRPVGVQDVPWNGTDATGKVVASGVYHLRMRAGGEEFSRPMVLVK